MKGLLIFAAGLAIGAVAGACVIKNKVLADAKEEIEEVREYYRSKREVKEEQPEVEPVTEEKEYKDIVSNNGYVNYNKPEKIQTSEFEDPYIIDPSEFGEEVGYDTETLTYFADGVLVDDVDDVIEEPDLVVGLNNLDIFEEFGASSIYVRNVMYKTDYEVLRDDWKYSDLKEPPLPVKEKKPHQL
jgi:hypothetical protein